MFYEPWKEAVEAKVEGAQRACGCCILWRSAGLTDDLGAETAKIAARRRTCRRRHDPGEGDRTAGCAVLLRPSFRSIWPAMRTRPLGPREQAYDGLPTQGWYANLLSGTPLLPAGLKAEDGTRAGVAQLVEHLICNQTVGGSNPFASSRCSAGRSEVVSSRGLPWQSPFADMEASHLSVSSG